MDFDLAEVLLDSAERRLDPSKLKWTPGASVCVVLASGGYPGKFEAGKAISGLTEANAVSDVHVFHAGTKQSGNQIVTSGGRVLGVTTHAANLNAALKQAYSAAALIHFDGMHYRRDIGAHADAHAVGN